MTLYTVIFLNIGTDRSVLEQSDLGLHRLPLFAIPSALFKPNCSFFRHYPYLF